MKTLIAFFILLLPQLLVAQKVVTLSVNQPPELGFSISRNDTTIMKGSSITLGTDIFVSGGSGIYSYKWSPGKSLNDSLILHPFATLGDTTNFMLTVTDKNGCSFSVAYTVNVKTPNTRSKIFVTHNNLFATLFPNPNEGNFKVKLTGKPTRKIELYIIDSAGKILQKQIIRNFQGECIETFRIYLISGIYTMLIHSDNEKLSRQFIIN